MLKQLGSMPFCKEYLSEETVGHWAIETDPGKEPRMYADDVMLSFIGLTEPLSPEETFKAWLAGVDKDHLDSVFETEKLNIKGIPAEVQYPWHYPDGRTILVRCEGVRNYSYKDGIRTEGRHRNITELVRFQKESAVISALAKDFECVDYVILKDNKYDDILIPYRTSERVKRLIPVWEKELSFHNRLKLLIDQVGYKDDVDNFFAQTRREVILEHLEREPAYYVNGRAVVEDGAVEYFQFKFTADKDENGCIVGLIVGIHSINDEMREELALRQKIERIVSEKTEELKVKNEALSKVNEHMIALIGDVVENRDADSGEHINRVKYLTRILGVQVMKDLPEYRLTMDDVTAIANMSPLHDVGKIKIPDSILLKAGRLTPEEFEEMKTHCDKGCEILSGMSGIWNPELVRLSMDITRYHHEKWDGKGYPCGLKGDEIPISAQIVSIADAYDALVSERCYKRAFTHEQACSMIMNGECGAFSDKLLACFAKCRKGFMESSAYMHNSSDLGSSITAFANAEYIFESMSLVEEISESMPGGFFIYQADGDEKILYFNSLLMEYLGCSTREEFIEYTGNSFKGIVPAEDYHRVREEIYTQILLGKNNLDHVYYHIRRKDGKMVLMNDYGRFIKSGDMGDVFFVFVSEMDDK